MANWDVNWRPSYGFEYGADYNVLVTGTETGAEQRRLKGPARQVFKLSFDARQEDALDAIQSFYDQRNGLYEEFSFPSYGEAIKGTRLGCVNGSPARVEDNENGFISKRFDDTHDAWINGSAAGNNGIKGVASVSAGTLTLDGGESLSLEYHNNPNLEILKTYNVRFSEKKFRMKSVNYRLWACIIELIEVLDG